MDAKTEAQRRRRIADLLDQVAEEFKPLNATAAESYEDNAEANRRIAERLDPPQPEWQDGDLVRDRFGTLWEYELEVWHCHHANRGTEALTNTYGPLTRVLTYDPATQRVTDRENDVIVNLDDIDRKWLNGWHDPLGEDRRSQMEVARIVAKAAREQLGEVQ